MRSQPTTSAVGHMGTIACMSSATQIFYEDVPAYVRNRGPWRGDRGEIVRLKPELRLALAEARYDGVSSESWRYRWLR